MSHRVALHLLLTTLALSACAPRGQFTVEGRRDGATETIIPIEVKGGLPVTRVEIGGAERLLIVDLGSFDTLALRPEVVEAAGGTWTGAHKGFADAYGKSLSARRFVLPEVDLGGLVLRELVGHQFVTDLGPERVIGEPVDGLIGAGVLLRFGVLYDYPGGQVVLAHGEALPADSPILEWSRWKVASTTSGVRGQAVVDGRKRPIVLDTGASRSVVHPDAVDDADVRMDGAMRLTTASIVLGDADIGAQDLVLLPFRGPNADILLGYDFFAARRVYVSAGAKWVAVEE